MASRIRRARFLAPLLFLVPLFALTGCAGLFSGGFHREPLLLVGFEGNTRVHPGDALEVEAVLISQHRKPLLLPFLSAGSVSFWFTDSTGRTYKRDPVAPASEDTTQLQPLEPGKRWRRRFVITQATETTGTLRIQLVYGAGSTIEHQLPEGPVSSDPIAVSVSGEQLVHRDSAGVLLSADAVRLAREWAQMPEASASATLVRNEWGALVWWVRLNPDGVAPTRKACFVDPYRAVVRAEADPAVVPPTPKEPELKVPPPAAPPQPFRDFGTKTK